MVLIIEKLKTNILSNDAQAVLGNLEQLDADIRNDAEVLRELLSPATITELHSMLVEHLGVNHRLLQIRRGNHPPKLRALMFIKAMESGVSKIESMVQKGK